MSEILACPACGLHCQGEHRLKLHFRGRHLKGLDEPSRQALLAQAGFERIAAALAESAPDTEDDEGLIDDRPGPGSPRIASSPPYKLSAYLDESKFLCREERQYALFLYDEVRRGDPLVLARLGIGGAIRFCAYEAAIMRDFWYADKARFNVLLRAFVESVAPLGSVIGASHPGHHASYWERSHPLAAWMMNVKPDLCVLYESVGELRFRFIECKYLSDEDRYCMGDISFTQRQTQDLVAGFICEHFEFEGRRMAKDETLLLDFSAEEAGSPLSISSLIRRNLG